MISENTLASWIAPSSDTEQEKQERAERMIRQAIDDHEPFRECSLNVYAKGSYANNTNVRSDSDVDIAVECTEVTYWEESKKGNYETPGAPYKGVWTPEKLRAELILAMKKKFPGQVDTSGVTAIQINANTVRVNADVVPCFSYRYYMENGHRDGTKIFKVDGRSIENYPLQQIRKGKDKNNKTNYNYKKCVRILKRIENAMAIEGKYKELPSYFMECLAYNCPDHVFKRSTWTECLKDILIHIYNSLSGAEPSENRWLEVNECFYLFHPKQKWSRQDGQEFAQAAWSYCGF
ncbi:nucleotidyltransferase [Acinetobacter lactucae]|uniref:nucleotidyltransferase domain-containing protein n=1 Tax=Acinetobacter calcoaceticus/baumannii complex TaxID=909768 RepID=UPI0039F6C1AF